MKTKIGRKELLEKALNNFGGHLSYYAAGEEYRTFKGVARILAKDEQDRNKIRQKYGFPAIDPLYDIRDIWFGRYRKTFDIKVKFVAGYFRYSVQEFLNPNLFEFEKRIIKRAIHKVEKEIDEDSIKLGRKLARLDKLKNDYGEGI